jgi:DNA-binding transcriptional regulator YiaG
MSDIAGLFKGEIVRLSNKVIREFVTPLKTAATAQKRQLSAMRQQIQLLERELKLLRRGLAPGPASKQVPEHSSNVRFSAKGFATLRAKLGLSAREIGLLLSVSAQAVYNWESKQSKPRAAQIAAVAALRGLGKKEVARRLSQIVAQTSEPPADEQ